MNLNKEFDSSWFEDLPRHISIWGDQQSGLKIHKQQTCCKIDLGNSLHTEQMKTLFEYWLADDDLYIKTRAGLSYYIGPRSI